MEMQRLAANNIKPKTRVMLDRRTLMGGILSMAGSKATGATLLGRGLRVFVATFGTETNSFSPLPTGLDAFQATMLWRPGEHPDFATEATGPLWAARERAREGRYEVIEGTCAFAMPGGPVSAQAYQLLRDEILDQLRRAMPVDIVAFGLHGAMLAFGEDECEADLLERARAIVGPDVALGAELDLHAHLSPRMVRAADVIVAFKYYPHTDYVERARDLLDLLERVRAGEIRPTSSLFDCRMVGGLTTQSSPMKDLVAELIERERRGEVLSGSLIQGFRAGDVARMGSKVLIYTNNDQPAAASIAQDFARRYQAMAPIMKGNGPERSFAADIELAKAATAFPVILVDSSDNPGGGASGDNMALARAMLDNALIPACIGPIWDPLAVRLAFEAGLGADFSLRVGGKVGEASGLPLDVRGKITGLAKNVTQNLQGSRPPLGRVVCISTGGLDIIVSEIRDQCYGPEMFRAVGVEPAKKRYVAVKSSEQWRIGFGDMGRSVIYVASSQQSSIRHYHKRSRPMWPFEPVDFSA
uniref:Microcystinase C n=6 Tax=Sphingomonadaceae TaxID=41297 RepID=M4T5Q3_9SPHN